MSSNAEKKILKGDARALKHLCGKNTSGKGVNFSLSLLCLEQKPTGLNCSKGDLGQDVIYLFNFFFKQSTEIDFWEKMASIGGFKGQIRQLSVRHPHSAEGQGNVLHGLSEDCFSSVFCDFLLANKMKLYSQHRSVWLSRQYFVIEEVWYPLAHETSVANCQAG